MKMSDGLLARLDKLKERYAELGVLLARPEIVSDQNLFKNYSKEHSDLQPAADKYEEYLAHKRDLNECENLLAAETDPDMRGMLKEELETLRVKMDSDADELRIALLPKDPDEDNNVIMEIRAGAGGDEAALFGTELMKMYRHYADRMRWKVEEINMNYTELGGAKELTFMIAGKGAWGNLKFESGVHRLSHISAPYVGGSLLDLGEKRVDRLVELVTHHAEVVGLQYAVCRLSRDHSLFSFSCIFEVAERQPARLLEVVRPHRGSRNPRALVRHQRHAEGILTALLPGKRPGLFRPFLCPRHVHDRVAASLFRAAVGAVPLFPGQIGRAHV